MTIEITDLMESELRPGDKLMSVGDDINLCKYVQSVFSNDKPAGKLKSDKIEYQGLSNNDYIDLVNLSGGDGYISSLFLAFTGSKSSWRNSRVRIYYGGNESAEVDVPVEHFFMATYLGDQPENSRFMSKFFKYNGDVNNTSHSAMSFDLPIPYCNGIRIELFNNSGVDIDSVFCTVTRHSGVSCGWSRTKKLLVDYLHESAVSPDQTVDLINHTVGEKGRLAAVWMLMDAYPGKVNPMGRHLEGNVKIIVDGDDEGYESSGTEDFFLLGYYFETITKAIDAGNVGVTYVNAKVGPELTVGAYRFFDFDPVCFDNSIKITWQCGDKSQQNFTGTTVLKSSVFYYSE